MSSSTILKHAAQAFVFCAVFCMVSSNPLPNRVSLDESTTERNRGDNKKGIFDMIMNANKDREVTLTTSRAKSEEPLKLFQVDIVMTDEIKSALDNSGTDEMVLRPYKGRRSARRHKRAANSIAIHKWPIVSGSRQIPYVIESSSVADQSLIEDAMTHWTINVPCISFIPRSNEADYISFFKGQGCYSYTGRQGGNQRVSIGSECAQMGVIAHEIGHVLGFWHEQSRPDRDSYVRILWNNVIHGKEDDFKKIINGTDDLGIPYDFDSLMHYAPTAFANANGVRTIEKLDGTANFGTATTLSSNDVEQAKLMYCPGTTACSSLYQDINTSCPAWVSSGYCDDPNYKSFMKANCKKSCLCRPCVDQNANCASYAALGYCTNPTYIATMSVNCIKTCEFCS